MKASSSRPGRGSELKDPRPSARSACGLQLVQCEMPAESCPAFRCSACMWIVCKCRHGPKALTCQPFSARSGRNGLGRFFAMAISKNRKKRNRRRQRLQAEAEVCRSETAEATACGSPETTKGEIEEPTLTGDQAPNVDVMTELQEELRQVRGDLLLLSRSNKGLLILLRRMRSNTALQKKVDDKTRMLEKEQECEPKTQEQF